MAEMETRAKEREEEIRRRQEEERRKKEEEARNAEVWMCGAGNGRERLVGVQASDGNATLCRFPGRKRREGGARRVVRAATG